jgi:hypothetical protein
MHPDSSHAAFYRRRKAFLGHVKTFLSDGDSGTGSGLDQVFCRVGKIENSFDESGDHS